MQLVTEYQPRIGAYIQSLDGGREPSRGRVAGNQFGALATQSGLSNRQAVFALGVSESLGCRCFRICATNAEPHRCSTPTLRNWFRRKLRRRPNVCTKSSPALSECLNSLPEKRRQMIQDRYFESQTIDQIANAMSQGSSNVRVTLMRVRRQLAECIERRLATGGAS